MSEQIDSNLDNEGLFSLLYEELRTLAGHVCRGNTPSAMIQPTMLVNEVYLKMAKALEHIDDMNETRMLAIAAKAMRQVCIDHARSVRTQKRGGDWQRVTISNVQADHGSELCIDLLDLDEILLELGQFDPRQLQVVELRFFGGMSAKQIAEVLDISPKRVELDWRMARAWLAIRLDKGSNKETDDQGEGAENAT